MARVLASIVALLSASCLGPLLPLPEYPAGVHVFACARIACPALAAVTGGIVTGSCYIPSQHVCQCEIEDVRHMKSYVFVNPHRK